MSDLVGNPEDRFSCNAAQVRLQNVCHNVPGFLSPNAESCEDRLLTDECLLTDWS